MHYTHTYPDRRAQYPPKPWGEDTPNKALIFGYDYMWEFGAGVGWPAQHLRTTYRRVAPCGLPPLTYNDHVIWEYFRAPGYDLQSMYGDPEMFFSSLTVATGNWIFLDDSAPKIAVGEIAADLGAYLSTLTNEKRAKFEDELGQNALFRWEHDYEYDGCNMPPQGKPATRCGRVHCAKITYSSRASAAEPWGSPITLNFDRD